VSTTYWPHYFVSRSFDVSTGIVEMLKNAKTLKRSLRFPVLFS